LYNNITLRSNDNTEFKHNYADIFVTKSHNTEGQTSSRMMQYCRILLCMQLDMHKK